MIERKPSLQELINQYSSELMSTYEKRESTEPPAEQPKMAAEPVTEPEPIKEPWGPADQIRQEPEKADDHIEDKISGQSPEAQSPDGFCYDDVPFDREAADLDRSFIRDPFGDDMIPRAEAMDPAAYGSLDGGCPPMGGEPPQPCLPETAWPGFIPYGMAAAGTGGPFFEENMVTRAYDDGLNQESPPLDIEAVYPDEVIAVSAPANEPPMDIDGARSGLMRVCVVSADGRPVCEAKVQIGLKSSDREHLSMVTFTGLDGMTRTFDLPGELTLGCGMSERGHLCAKAEYSVYVIAKGFMPQTAKAALRRDGVTEVEVRLTPRSII